MHKYIFLLLLPLLFSCRSVPTDLAQKYFDGKDLPDGQIIAQHLPVGTPMELYFDQNAPRNLITEDLYTDPCKVYQEKTPITTNEWDRGYMVDEIKCTMLRGPWVATFVNLYASINGEEKWHSMPALVKVGNYATGGKVTLTPIPVYLNEHWNEPVLLFVEFPGNTIAPRDHIDREP